MADNTFIYKPHFTTDVISFQFKQGLKQGRYKRDIRNNTSHAFHFQIINLGWETVELFSLGQISLHLGEHMVSVKTGGFSYGFFI